MEKPNVKDVEELVNEEVKEETEEVKETEPVKTSAKKARKSRATKKEEVVEDTTDVKSWKEVFMDNYNGTSAEAKALQPLLKDNYKGDVYVPWAVMERLTYMCDEHARFIVIENRNGGIVHTDVMENIQYNAQKGEVISDTKSLMFSHTVKVACIFMGKEFIEDYPIQEIDYTAARIYNQNLVNRAIQRAKAKVAARATGLALKLYEGFDLQFEIKDETPKKPNVKGIVEEKTEAPKKETKTVDKPVEKPVAKEEPKKEVEMTDENQATPVAEVDIADPNTKELIEVLRNNDQEKVNSTLQRANVSIMRKYNFALALTDTDEQLAEKISKFPDIEKFKNSIKNMLGL